MPIPVNLPQPVFMSGGYKQRPASEEILIRLLSQAPSLIGSIMGNQQQQPFTGGTPEEEIAKSMLIGQATGGNPAAQQAVTQNLPLDLLGNARTSGQALPQIQQFTEQAPGLLRNVEADTATVDAQKLLDARVKRARTMGRSIPSLRGNPEAQSFVENLFATRITDPDLIPAADFGNLLAQNLEPTAKEEADLALSEIRRQEVLQSMRIKEREIKQEDTKHVAIQGLAEQLGIDWYAPGLESQVIDVYQEKDKPFQERLEDLTIQLAGTIRTDLLGNPIQPFSATEAFQEARQILSLTDPEGAVTAGEPPPEVGILAEAKAAMLPLVQEAIDTERSLEDLRKSIMPSLTGMGLTPEQAAALFNTMLRQVRRF